MLLVGVVFAVVVVVIVIVVVAVVVLPLFFPFNSIYGKFSVGVYPRQKFSHAPQHIYLPPYLGKRSHSSTPPSYSPVFGLFVLQMNLG